jgi:hypothetical protein
MIKCKKVNKQQFKSISVLSNCFVDTPKMSTLLSYLQNTQNGCK